MKGLIIYSSTTGFTEKYAKWLAEKLQADLLTINEATKKPDTFFEVYEALVYGGWALAGKIHKSKWFLDRLEHWKGKRLALFCVGASPSENVEEVREALSQVLTPKQAQYAKVFYCPGGLNYERMPITYRMAMRTFAFVMKRKHPEDTKMHRILSTSYDNSDPVHLDPIVEYLTITE